MAQTTDEIAATSREMERSMKKLPKQGAIGVGILTAAEFLAR
jgi:transposase